MTDNAEPQVDRKTTERELPKVPFGAPHVLVLAAIEGGDTTAVHRVGKPDTVIGRGPEADFDVDDEQVSKRHCAIRVNGPVCTVIDLGSLNGTSLNDRELRPGVALRIRHLDEIGVGDTRLIFLSGRFKDR